MSGGGSKSRVNRSMLSSLKEAGALNDLMLTSRKTGQAGPRDIPLDLIEPDPEQPRKHIDEDKLASLAESISVQGVLQPITVQPFNGGGRHLIIMGERRYRAAKLAGLKSIPAIEREMTGELRMAQLTENVQRDGLTTFEIAAAVSAMREAGKSRSDIACALGWGESEVSRFAAVIEMPEPLQQLAEKDVPVRALSDLYALWKKNPEAVEEFVQISDAADVSRVTVARLRSRLTQEITDAVRAPRTVEDAAGGCSDQTQSVGMQTGGDTAAGQAASLDQGETVKAPEVLSAPGTQKNSGGRGAAIICKHGGALGRLLTDQIASSPKAILVSFENGRRVEEVPLSELELIEVVAL
ncbi:ParB/RepB/Spo0J family partition protein (plasmid) [Leisingera sp. M527]|uniref:ParB/RepB/Spo0J family partition protein n=1 Tax=Leisingera sp. M527 TaxID=2867014 RepID=UPI0021A291D2|nr:ParB/RepB/Spo0J family partition protein [Leisingera sp. M527]UWQ35393.1 ParB/RepB/Spo0J family partition protein [Leisingera sp. M527]